MKRMCKVFGAVLLALVVGISMTVPVMAQGGKSLENREYDIGLSAGIWFPGEISIDAGDWSLDVDKETSPLFRVIADMYLMPKFAIGGYANYSFFTLSKEDYELDGSMFEFGMAFKPKIMLSPTMALKPGLNIGYRRSDRDSIGVGDDDTSADGLAINLSAELQFQVTGGYILYADFGFLTQPAGGSDDADVTWAPIVYALVGFCF